MQQLLPKQVLKKHLFQLRVPLSYKNCMAAFEACQNDSLVMPKGVTADHVMLLKKVLQNYRQKSGKTNKQLVQLERDMIEKAAEMGQNDAIALLAGEVLSDFQSQEGPERDHQDRSHADQLLIQLMDQGHPLAFKVSGDLAYKSGQLEKAVKFYQLAVDHNVEQSVKVECLRNIGLIQFMDRNIQLARRAFQKAIDNSTDDPGKVMDCHFYLGQILDSNKKVAKYHFERAAAHGLKDAFAPLGFLNLNYFANPSVAEEWFKLGKEAGDMNSLVGLLDVYGSKDKSLEQAVSVYEAIKRYKNSEQVLKLRPETVERIEAYKHKQTAQLGTGSNGRWGF